MTFTPIPTNAAQLVPLENEPPENLLAWLCNYETLALQTFEFIQQTRGRWQSVEQMNDYHDQWAFFTGQLNAVKQHIIMRMEAWTNL